MHFSVTWQFKARYLLHQALNAILFLHREVLKIALPWLEGVQRAKKPRPLPVVLTRQEIKRALAQLDDTVW